MDDGVTLAVDREWLRPGGEVTGVVRWRLAQAPARGELRLRWDVAGKVAAEHEVVGTVSLTTLPRSRRPSADGGAHPFRDAAVDDEVVPLAAIDERRFRIDLPDAPYSFIGKLFRLTWSLEVEIDGAITRVTLVVGPERCAVTL